MRVFRILTIFLFFSTAVFGGDKRPNILLILADDLGYSDLGCFGGEIQTPNLDNLAANGLRMSQLYNTARCCSTRASLLTGLHAHQAGVGAMMADNGLPGYRGFLTDRCVTIAQLLQESGYKTYLSGKWHLRGKGNPECLPTKRGFGDFYGHFRAYASFWRPDFFVRLPEGRPGLESSADFYATDSITDYALDFIADGRDSENPWFLYLAYNAPHFPLHAPKEVIDKYSEIYQSGWDEIRTSRHSRMIENGIISDATRLSTRSPVTKVPNRNRDSAWYGKQIPAWDSLPENRRNDLARRMATYAAMVEIMDRNIGRVVKELRDNGELNNTLIVFLSDNGACAEWDPHGFDDNPYPKNKLYEGEALDEVGQPGTFHSYGTGWANACNTPFRLYKHYNHEGGISSPTIIHWPDKVTDPGRLDRQPAHITDISATILEQAEIDYPEKWDDKPVLPLAGTSLQPVLSGAQLPERPLFFEHEGNRAVRLGKWKIVWTNYQKTWELYDISVDRTEMNNLAAELPEKVQELERLWIQWADSHFVEHEKVKQPSGMPKIYYLPRDEAEAARQIRNLGGHAFLNLQTGRIKEINLNRNQLTNDATMSLVGVCREVTDLSLEKTPVGDLGLAKITDFKNIEWLNLYQTRITDRGVKSISTLKNLKHLPIGETGVTDSGLPHLSSFKKLEYLGLRGNKITDSGVKHLEDIYSLKALHLGATGISDVALSSIEKLTGLEKLWLHDTPVSGNAVKTLISRLPDLKELHLQRTDLKIGEVQKMRKMFPDCAINYESD